VTDVAVGDRVFGVSDEGAGAAELALLTFRAIIPPSLGFVDAAGLPTALETAARAIDQLGVTNGSTRSSTAPPAGSPARPSSSPSRAARA
jgi:NADPH:quinone reductase-like Zn-dependent oxidoreductase